MKYIVPSSKIVFTDCMILLVAMLMGLNSVMSFSKDVKEILLPSAVLAENSELKDIGLTLTGQAFITIVPSENGLIYFYNDSEVPLDKLAEYIQKTAVPAVTIRVDRETVLEWDKFMQMIMQLVKAGIKEINYATRKGGKT